MATSTEYPTGPEIIEILKTQMEYRAGQTDTGFAKLSRKRKFEVLKEKPRAHALAIMEARVRDLTISSVKGETWNVYFTAVRAWADFADIAGIPHFPISVERVPTFVGNYNNASTAEGVLSALEKIQRFMGIDTPIRTRQTKAVVQGMRREQGPTRKMDPIDLHLLDQIVKDASPTTPTRNQLHEFNFVAVISYVYLLRTKDEVLPLCRGLRTDVPHTAIKVVTDKQRHSSVFLYQNELYIALRSRKNSLQGAVLSRGCTCRQMHVKTGWRAICPVHCLWPYIRDNVEPGCPIWSISYPDMLSTIKAKANRYKTPMIGWGTHSFRRGAAQDSNDSNPELRLLLRAGNWTSNTFKEYIDWSKLEKKTVEKICEESPDESE
ncbi:hypothetical protein DIPPA_12914 [Diplonema papillatum]|nr:hypothetical protein DIPPA_23310 [Diplonema papillatum]KAJ9463995.1 hypothetical protein DIPPA_12914 [Diplonema papillatum]